MALSPQETFRRAVGATSATTPSARITQPVDVAWYGAVGDGVTDDTAAITAAITAAGANGTVLFRPGKSYLTTTQITIPADGVTLTGYGAIITSATQDQYRKFLFTSRTRGSVLGIRFNCIQTNGSGVLGAAVIEASNSTDLVIKDCEFNDVRGDGVYLLAACARATISGNKFYRNFCSIFFDDDLVNQPIECRIIANLFLTGLGTTATAFSGAIKMSGIGSTTTKVGHVISGNIIDAPGQMGIEIQTFVNDCAIHGNTVNGAGYGISLSGVDRGSVVGNTVRNSAIYGIELASACKDCTISGNTVTTAGVNMDGIVVSGATTTSAIIGNTLQQSNIHTVGSNAISITGNTLRNGVINIQTSYAVTVTGGNIVISTDLPHAVIVDVSGSSGVLAGFTISGNEFRGAFSISIIRFISSSGSAIIDAALITGNNTVLATTAGTGFDMVFTGSTTTTRNCRNYGNIGIANGFHQSLLNLDVETVTANTTLVFNRRWLLVDATSGNKVITFPDATLNFGIEFGVKKIDGSVNTVTCNTIDGGAHVLTAQYEYMEAISSGFGAPAWALIGDN